MDSRYSFEGPASSKVEEGVVKQMFNPCMMLSARSRSIARIIIVQLAAHHKLLTSQKSTFPSVVT